MEKQLSLFESGPEYNLVLAVFPDAHTAQQIADLGNSLRKAHRLKGKVRPTNHLHVSMPVPQIMRRPKTVIENVGQVCGDVAASIKPFEIRFDSVMSFRGGENRPVVLVNNSQGNDRIAKLHGLLCAGFAKLGFTVCSTSRFVPHLTILYSQKALVPQPLIPIGWRVGEIVLVLSEVGATKYHLLGRWKFADESQRDSITQPRVTAQQLP